MQGTLHEFPEVIGNLQCLIVRRYVCISCHADVIRVGYFVLVKYQIQVFHDDFLHADITDVMSRKHQDIGYIGRNRYDSEDLFFFFVVFILPAIDMLQIGCYVDIFIHKMRERVAAVYDLR